MKKMSQNIVKSAKNLNISNENLIKQYAKNN